MSEQHKRELVSAGEATFSNMLTVNALVELRYHNEERRARALGSSGIRYPAKRNMRHYARVQPQDTTEFDSPRLGEDSADGFSGVPKIIRPSPLIAHPPLSQGSVGSRVLHSGLPQH